MNRLFEDFIKGFARAHFPDSVVSKRQVPWNAASYDGAETVLPRMETDVAIDHGDEKLIIECKFYKDGVMTTGNSLYDGGKLRSSHLYQILAYLTHQSTRTGWREVKGVLLYPTVRPCSDFHYTIHGHDLWIRSLNLNQNWKEIEHQLKSMIAPV